MVRSEEARNQEKNEEIAYQRLYDKLKIIEDSKNYEKNKNYRNDQIGNGSRGGTKRRTYRIREDMVQDHITGKSCRWSDILRGKIELLS
jgi:protein subunit release factor A